MKVLAGNDWTYVGQKGISSNSVLGTAGVFHLSADSTGTPYVVYRDNNLGATVKKFDGNSWLDMGKAMSYTGPIYMAIAASRSDNIYVASINSHTQTVPTVEKFDGTSWSPVGAIYGYASEPGSLLLANDGTPYYFSLVEDSVVIVQKHDGTNWVTLNRSAVSKDFIMGNFYINSRDSIYFAFVSDAYNFDSVYIKKFDGNGWKQVCPPYPAFYFTVGFTVDPSGHPYLSYSNRMDLDRPYVVKYDGTAWVPVGSNIAPINTSPGTYITTDGNGVPYLLFHTYPSFGANPEIRKFDGVTWVNPGNNAPFTSNVTRGVLHINDSNTVFALGISNTLLHVVRLTAKDNIWRSIGKIHDAAAYTIASDKVGNPYIAYCDSKDLGKVKVTRYDGTKWIDMGIVSRGTNRATFIQIKNERIMVSYAYYNWFAKTTQVPVGIKKVDAANQALSIFPNPAGNIVKIAIDDVISEGAILSVYDLSGKEIYRDMYKGSKANEITISVNDLASGVYIIKLAGNDRQYTGQMHVCH